MTPSRAKNVRLVSKDIIKTKTRKIHVNHVKQAEPIVDKANMNVLIVHMANIQIRQLLKNVTIVAGEDIPWREILRWERQLRVKTVRLVHIRLRGQSRILAKIVGGENMPNTEVKPNA